MKKKKKVILLIMIIIVFVFFNKVYAFSDEWTVFDIDYKISNTNKLIYIKDTVKLATQESLKSTKNTNDTPDSIMQSAQDFIATGESLSDIDENSLAPTSDFLYNLLLAIGIVVAVIVGLILGIKYMIGSTEEQADIKQILIPYIVGCFVVFGAFGIWKIAVNILLNM